MKVSAIVLNFNLPKDTISVISDLKRQTVNPEIIVVDNGSTDDSVEKIKTAHPDVTLLRYERNIGSVGYNLGIKHALKNNADYIILLNNDLIISQKDCLEILVDNLKLNKKAGSANPIIYFAKGYEYEKTKDAGKIIWFAGGKIDWNNIFVFHQGVNDVDRGQYSHIVETDFANTATAAFKSEVFNKVGLLNEKYFAYFDDVEFSQRVKNAGYKLLFVPGAKVSHKVSQTPGNKIGGGINDYYLTRNRLLFGMRFASMRTKFALLREAVKLLFIGRKNQKKGVKDFFMGKRGICQ